MTDKTNTESDKDKHSDDNNSSDSESGEPSSDEFTSDTDDDEYFVKFKELIPGIVCTV